MPTIKTGTKDTNKMVTSLASTPRKTRRKSKKRHKSEPDLSVPDNQQPEEPKSRRCRSRSRGRGMFRAAMGKLSLKRSRSRSKKKQSTEQPPEISLPIISTNSSRIFSQSPLVIPPEEIPNSPEPNNQFEGFGMDIQRSTSSTLQDSISPMLVKAEVEDLDFERNTGWRMTGETPISPGQMERPNILTRLQAYDPSRNGYCDTCLQPVHKNDRYNLVGRVVHRSCFLCANCGECLTNRTAVCQKGIWSCAAHFDFDVTCIEGVAN